MRAEHPRARRYPLVACVELTDIRSETQIKEQISDLNLFGCRVDTKQLLPPGTKVRIRITHGGANFVALGKVMHFQPNVGMGIVFTSVGQRDQAILEKWIAELRHKQE